MNKVVAHPKTGEVLTINPKSGWGTFRVDSSQRVIENGVFRIAKRTAFISVAPDQIENFDLKVGESLPGIIQKQRSATPLYETHKPAINPSTGEVMPYYLHFELIADANAPSFVELTPETIPSAEEVNAPV